MQQGAVMKSVKNQELVYMNYVRRENCFLHHTYDEERRQYELFRLGDSSALTLGYEKFTGHHNGTLSKNPLRNKQYLFVVEATQTARACIQGGMPYQIAYDLSDLYVQKADNCKCIDELNELYRDMTSDYLHRLITFKSQSIDSKPIKHCVDYIYYHLHEKITVSILSKLVGLNPSYLSILFKKIMNSTISAFIREQKLDTAKNMLKYSNFSISEICTHLALGSQSHFTELLKRDCGLTPKQYRDQFSDHPVSTK